MSRLMLNGLPYGCNLANVEPYSFSVDYSNGALFNQTVTTWPATLEYTATKDCVAWVFGQSDGASNVNIYVNGIQIYQFAPADRSFKQCITVFLKRGDTISKRTLTDSTTIYVRYLIYPVKQQSLHDYSTSEHVVATWIDGKPVYEKTFSASTPVVTTDGTYASKHTDITSLNVETVVDYDIMMYNASLSQYVKIMYLNNSNYMVKGYVDIGNSRFTILCNASAFSDKQTYVTLRYTKTTD